MSNWLPLLVTAVLMFALGLGNITYPAAALERGWERGKWANDPLSFRSIAGVVSVIASLVHTVGDLGWFYLPITVVGGYFVMAILLSRLKSSFQVVGLGVFLVVPLGFYVFGKY